jgi:hypothetical protein
MPTPHSIKFFDLGQDLTIHNFAPSIPHAGKLPAGFPTGHEVAAI